VDIVIATPGRLVDHLNGTLGFTLQHLRYLVIDEADRLLTQSYQNWLPQVLNALQKPKERDLRLLSTVDDDMNEQSVDKNNIDNKNNRGDNEQSYPLPTAATSRSECLRYYPTLQKLLFSATLSHNPKKIASLQLVNPRFFAFTSQFVYKIPETLKQHLVVCKTDVKPLALVYLFQKLKASQILCFTSSVETTHRLHLLMKTLISEEILPSKFKFVEYSSQLSQKEKVKIVKHFKEGLINLIICSDVMSRGLDIEDVDVVINYEIPKHIKTYVHRCAQSISFAPVRNNHRLLLLRVANCLSIK
jgi:ATP-dependent RNA helicase DDX51/DBP6